MKLAILPHLVTPHGQPLNPSPPMGRWLIPANIFEGECMAESKTVHFSFFFNCTCIHSVAHRHFGCFAIFCHPSWVTPWPLCPQVNMTDATNYFWRWIHSWIHNHLVSAQNETSVWKKITFLLILVHFATPHARPLDPSCLQMVQSLMLHKYTCTFVIFVITCCIILYFFSFFDLFYKADHEISHFAPYAQPLNPSPPMARWLMPPDILEGESIAESKIILFFFHFFLRIFIHFSAQWLFGHFAPFCHPSWATPHHPRHISSHSCLMSPYGPKIWFPRVF